MALQEEVCCWRGRSVDFEISKTHIRSCYLSLPVAMDQDVKLLAPVLSLSVSHRDAHGLTL